MCRSPFFIATFGLFLLTGFFVFSRTPTRVHYPEATHPGLALLLASH